MEALRIPQKILPEIVTSGTVVGTLKPQICAELGVEMCIRDRIKVGDMPVGLFIFLAVAIVCAIILNKTKIGRYILSLGSNKEAVRLSGVDVKKWEMISYIICGPVSYKHLDVYKRQELPADDDHHFQRLQ